MTVEGGEGGRGSDRLQRLWLAGCVRVQHKVQLSAAQRTGQSTGSGPWLASRHLGPPSAGTQSLGGLQAGREQGHKQARRWVHR